jgi:hypothetical protein
VQVIRIRSSLTTIADPASEFSAMVPVLVPLAFTGDLAYRIDYFPDNISYRLPAFGRQFGFNLGHLSFTISAATIHWTGLVLMGIDTVSGHYVLHRGSLKKSILNCTFSRFL